MSTDKPKTPAKTAKKAPAAPKTAKKGVIVAANGTNDAPIGTNTPDGQLDPRAGTKGKGKTVVETGTKGQAKSGSAINRDDDHAPAHHEETCEPALPDISDRPIKQRLFVEEYPIDGNGAQAAIRAGYAPSRAAQTAYELLKEPDIKAHIDARLQGIVDEVRMSRERLLSDFESMVSADANELVEHRRHCCRYCWGREHLYQWTPAEYLKAQEKARLNKGDGDTGDAMEPELDCTGGLDYDKRLDPNPECPECHGDGVSEVFLKDTRNISRRARLIYAGTQVGKDGIKINLHSVDKARETLAKHLKIFEDKTEINITVVPTDELDSIYEQGRARSADRSEAVKDRAARLKGSEG